MYGNVCGGQLPNSQEKTGRIPTHNFGASWSLHQLASYLEIHPAIALRSILNHF